MFTVYHSNQLELLKSLLVELIRPERLDRELLARVPSYEGQAAPGQDEAISSALDAEIAERLRSLGYIE